MPLDRYRNVNREQWDERVDIHYDSTEYNVSRFIGDRNNISEVVQFDSKVLGDVTGKTLLHLQCHFGRDTLSWARLGAVVTGVDFSGQAIDRARKLSKDSSTPGKFVKSELYDTPSVLGETFDIVYTGIGALCWLPNIRDWAKVVSVFLKPGGKFYIREGHPMLSSLDDERQDNLLSVRYPYFESKEPQRFDDEYSYAGEEKLRKTVNYEWSHGIGETTTALIESGLRIDYIREYKFLDWQALPCMVKGSDGFYRLPPDQQELVPLLFSIGATKETAQ